jgi:hypothetical protein
MTINGQEIDLIQLEAEARRARAEFVAQAFARLARRIGGAFKQKGLAPA